MALIGAAAYARACKTDSMLSFQLFLNNVKSMKGCASQVNETELGLDQVPEDYHEFMDVFSKLCSKLLPPHCSHDLSIQIEDSTMPLLGPIYSLSAVELCTLQQFIDKNLTTGLICLSKSSCGAPVLFVKKKDRSLRLCVDYRRLNRITCKDHYPIPLILDLLDAPKRVRIYRKIDLYSAYHLVRIMEGDEWKTPFQTQYGSYEWLVMPFGLSNAPSAFQCLMNKVFSDLLDMCVVIYLDNILEHKEHIREVLCRLRTNGLYASPGKCIFHRKEVKFLSYMLGPQGIQIDRSKIQTIQEWLTPRCLKDIQVFLGFINFYRRFIQDYSKITTSLTRLSCKSVPWHWSPECNSAFQRLKLSFTTAPVLSYWDPESPLMLETDASDLVIAAILSTYVEGELHPIAYHSRALNTTKLNYDIHDKELLVIFEAFKRWRHYLKGTSTTMDIITDHRNLIYFSESKNLSRRQARWSEYLSQFNL